MASLHDIGDGLLETHVTWHDVESEMQKALGTSAKFGDNKKATNISDQRGFLSKLALIDPDWISMSPNDKQAEQLPSQFVVKIATSLMIVDEKETEEEKENIIRSIRKSHNIEVFMYIMLDKYRENSSILRTIKTYGSRQFTNTNTLKGFIIAEFIPNVQHIEVCHPMTLDDIKPIVKCCAAFSAIGERMAENELEKIEGEGMIETYVNNYFKYEIENELHDNLKSILLLLNCDGDKTSQIDEFMRIINIYSSDEMLKKYGSISKYLGHKPVLMHSDVFPSNVLCSASSENSFILEALIDFQTVCTSSPGLDVASISCVFLSKNDRREFENELLDLYYSTFCNEILKYSATSLIPYTRQQLEDSHKLMFPIVSIFAISPLILLCKTVDGMDKSAAIDKTIGLVEDVISIHVKNLISFANFFE